MAACLLLSAYFSATETAFSSANSTRLKTLAEKGNKNAALACRLLGQYDKLLSTILIGNNIVNILMASIGTVLFVRCYGDAGATISTVVVTVVVLIFGEISPKSIAKDCAERFAMRSAPILQVFLYILTPLNFLFSLWKKLLAKVFRLNGQTFLDQIAPAFLLFHFWGRIGCFFAGCCYGKPADWGIAMQQTPDVPRIPIQLIETGCLLVIFTGLLLLQRRRSHAPALRIYLISYAVCRFALEFFRGDELRGIWLGRSTSQWISLAIILYFALAALLTDMNHRIHHTENWRKMNNEKENSNSNSIMRGMSGDTSEMSKDGVRQKYRDSER